MIFNKHNPTRPLSWRWEQARWLREHGRCRRRAKDDVYVRTAKRFQDMFRRCQSERARDELAYKMPGIFYAWQVFRNTDTDVRWTIEARLLTDESMDSIAEKSSTSTEVVYWYEKLFFDVRDHLHQRDYICNHVLGPAAHRGIKGREYDILLKLYALVGGKLVVDALVSMNSRKTAIPTTPDDVEAFWSEDGRDTLRRQAALSARTIPMDSESHIAILEAHHRLLQMEQAEMVAGGGDRGRLIVANLAAALACVGTTFQVSTPESDSQSVARSVEKKYGVELRASELLMSGAGVPVSLDDAEAYRFPDEVTNGTS